MNARRYVLPIQNVNTTVVQLHMTSRDAVFAKLCSEYFAEDAATFCLMSFHDVQRARECDDDLARFVKGLETIGMSVDWGS